MGTYQVLVGISHPSIKGPAINTWHLRTTSPPVTTELAEINGLMASLQQYYADIEGTMAGGTVFSFDGLCTGVLTDAGTEVTATPWTFTVEGSDEPLPSATAACQIWATSSATRSGRGRTFLSPVSTACLEADGTITATALGLYQTGKSNLISAFSGGGNGAFCVFSRKESLFRDITGGKMADKFAVLRSRRD